jgi:hypothetical protein
MPERQHRVAITTLARERASSTSIPMPTFALSSDDWSRLEDEYRDEIPAPVREKIEVETVAYIWLAECERKAVPLTSVRAEILRTQKATQQLLEQLEDIHNCKSDLHSAIGHLIRGRLRLPSRPPLSDHFGGLISDLAQLASILLALDPQDSGDYQQEGRAWRNWVRKLKVGLEEAGLPAGVSKAPDYPLLRLVNALQDKVPGGRKTSASGIGSLADAVYEAACAA